MKEDQQAWEAEAKKLFKTNTYRSYLECFVGGYIAALQRSVGVSDIEALKNFTKKICATPESAREYVEWLESEIEQRPVTDKQAEKGKCNAKPAKYEERYRKQFEPSAVTDEQLQKEAEELYPLTGHWLSDGEKKKQRKAYILGRKHSPATQDKK